MASNYNIIWRFVCDCDCVRCLCRMGNQGSASESGLSSASAQGQGQAGLALGRARQQAQASASAQAQPQQVQPQSAQPTVITAFGCFYCRVKTRLDLICTCHYKAKRTVGYGSKLQIILELTWSWAINERYDDSLSASMVPTHSTFIPLNNIATIYYFLLYNSSNVDHSWDMSPLDFLCCSVK